jgi:glycosyltransferase involved in cell wall biosynthesis
MLAGKLKLIIQIPCFNEEETLGQTVADLPTVVDGFDRVEWLVIDDGSSDRTSEIAKKLGVHHVVRHRHNRGLAAAFLTGLDTALRLGADVIVNTDADNQYSGASIPDLVRPVVEEGIDLVVGERPISSISEFSALKKCLQKVGTWVVRRVSGTPVLDAASGFRAMSREAALRFQVFGHYTYTMETLVQAGWEGLVVTSVPINVNPQTRPSRLVKSIPQYVFRSAQTIVRSFVLYNPFQFFFMVGMVPFLLGSALLTRWLFYFFFAETYSSRLPGLISGIAAIFIAGQIWAVAFLADSQSANRRVNASIRYHQRRLEIESEPSDA